MTLRGISISGEVQSNPGPTIDNKITTLCSVCQRTVRSYNRALECDVCKQWCHIKCAEISLREYQRLQNIKPFDWTCPSCISTLRILPFPPLDSCDGSFTSNGKNSCPEPRSQQILPSEDYLENLSRILNYSSKDLKVVPLNISSLQYKIEELRLLQRICGFDILGISETHLESFVPDNLLQIDGPQLIQRDRTKCKGGGVVLYYADHRTAVHRKDLLVRDIEAIWIQVKFPAHSTLFSVVYRSELETPNFFENFQSILERAWLKPDSIFVLGDLNCFMLEAQNNPAST